MKRQLLILFLTILSFSSYSQALVMEGSEWYCDYQTIFTYGVDNLFYSSDTIISDTLTHVISNHNQAYDEFQNYYSSVVELFYIHSTEDEVYHFINGEFQLLYDLNAAVGDTLITQSYYNTPSECSNVGFSIIDSVGVVNINGLDLRFIHLVDGENSPVSYNGYILERLGAIGVSFAGLSGGSFVPISNYSDCGLVDGESFHGGFKCYSDNEFFFSKLDTTNYACEFQFVGIDEYENQPLSIYPNPSEGRFVVEFPVMLSAVEADWKLSVYNSIGELVLSESYRNPKERMTIDLSDYSNGIYVVQMNIDGFNYSSRVVKE